MNSFNREQRYQVIKLKTGKPVECVVVESDWPEYEIVWKMIKDRCEGRPTEFESILAQLAEANAKVSALQESNDNWMDGCKAYSDMLRSICSELSVGGFNDEGLIPPSLAESKIRTGIDLLTRPLLDKLSEQTKLLNSFENALLFCIDALPSEDGLTIGNAMLQSEAAKNARSTMQGYKQR